MFDQYSIIAIVPLVVVLVLGLRWSKPQPVASQAEPEAITQPLAPRAIVAEVKPLELTAEGQSYEDGLRALSLAMFRASIGLEQGPATGPTIKLPELPASMVDFLENLE